MAKSLLVAIMGQCMVLLAMAATGPFKTKHSTFTYDAMVAANKKVDVVYPDAKGSFPLISYAHGFTDHGYSSYPKMSEELASWGYVVALHQACTDGCTLDCKTLLGDPPCFGHYYLRQMQTIEWILSSASKLKLPVNLTSGVAVAGHSMGGQSAVFAAAYNGTGANIKAATFHHAYTHSYPAIKTVPFIAFTGTTDTTAPPPMAEKVFKAAGAIGARGLVNKVGANHHEPTTSYNQKLALYSVAWIKIHLDKTPKSLGNDWDSLIFGNGTTSLCGGGDGKMKECTVLRG